MRKLLLIRHAKSSHKYPHLKDHDRPLNKHGERDRFAIGQWLAQKEKSLQIIISSTAVRSASLAETLGQYTKVPIKLSRDLYTFDECELFEAIKHIPGKYQNIAVIAHNPAVTEVVNYLGGDIANLPTSGIAAFECKLQSWQELSLKKCQLNYFVAPKLI